MIWAVAAGAAMGLASSNFCNRDLKFILSVTLFILHEESSKDSKVLWKLSKQWDWAAVPLQSLNMVCVQRRQFWGVHVQKAMQTDIQSGSWSNLGTADG